MTNECKSTGPFFISQKYFRPGKNIHMCQTLTQHMHEPSVPAHLKRQPLSDLISNPPDPSTLMFPPDPSTTHVGSETLGNRKGLSEIETTYSLERLNKAQEQGEKFLIIERKQNPRLWIQKLLLRNRVTGTFEHAYGRTVVRQYNKIVEYSEEEWELVRNVSTYGRNRNISQDWGAYIIPNDIVSGQQVYIADLIEDVVASGFWEYVCYATDAIATWKDDRLDLDYSAYDRFVKIG